MLATADRPVSPVLSWTKLDLLRRCPLAYRRRYIDRLPQPYSHPLAVGKAIHEWVEAVLRDGLDDDAALALLRRTTAVLPEEAGADAMQIGEAVIRLGRLPSLPSDAAGVEVESQWARTADGQPCAWDDPAALVRGVTDRRYSENDGALVAVQDWKTSHVAYAPGDQLRIYAWAEASADPHVEQVVVSLHFFRSGAVRREVYDAAELRETVPPMLLAVRAELERRIAENAWEPRVTSDCGHCDYRTSCPVMQGEVVPLRVITTADEAAEAAQRLQVLQTQAKEQEEALRAWAKANGPIVVGDEQVGFLPRERTEVVDVPRLAKALQARGVSGAELWRALRLSKSDAEKLAAASAPRGQKAAAKEAFVAEMVQLGAMETRTTTEWKRAPIGAAEGDE